jgi:hypothetical protein
MIEHDQSEEARAIERSVGALLPPDMGFAIVLFGLDETRPPFLRYISNCPRDVLIALLRGLVQSAEH